MTATQEETQPTTPLLAPRYRWSTIGAVGLVFLAAFESLAVTTVMPEVTRALDGQAYFSVAFSLTLAAGVLGTVAAGLWADGRGPRRPLVAAVGLFALGLLLAGLAPTIEVFVAARFLQGLGAGGLTVSLYVLVARLYDARDHPRILGAFSAAWVVPSLVGPTVAGAVGQAFGWRWVFLGVLVLAALASATIAPALRRVADSENRPVAGAGRRLRLAALVAAGVVVVDLGGRGSGPVAALAALAGLAVTLVALRPLLPAGTLVVRRGLPAVIALRGLVAGAFFASEIYLPYLLQSHYNLPPWLSGVTLTFTAFAWAGASQVQARLGDRLPHERALRIGSVLLLIGVLGVLAVAALHLPVLVMVLVWSFAGAGMGLLYARIAALVLAASAPQQQGENSAAMAIGDSVGAAVGIAMAGLTFGVAGGAEHRVAFVAVLVLTALVAAATTVVARRVSAR
ncbi:MFS transporter [Marmoricola endophyticus]|nr:MFS transporter [Marmoricola endophyticus]